MQNITAYQGEPHVTSDQFRSIIESIAGTGSYIADLDEQLEPELSTNNTLKIRSGVLIHHGHVVRVPTGTYDTVTYINGSQGMKRIDLVVARYKKNSKTKIEQTSWVVIQGTPAESDPNVPEYTAGNIQNGDLVDDCPVFEMHFDGLNVTEVKKLVEVTKNIDDLRKDVDKLNSTLGNKNSFIHVSSNVSVNYKDNDYICLNRTGNSISNQVGTFDNFGIFTFADNMTALVIADISGKPNNTDNKEWIQLMDYDNKNLLDSSIAYGTFTTCTIHKIITANRGSKIGIGVVNAFNLNSGGFASSMAVIRLN